MKKATSKTDAHQKARVNPSELRIQTLEIESIQSLVEDASHWLTVTESVLETCRKESIQSITVDGATKLERAVQLLNDFSSYAFRGANQALNDKRRRQSQPQKNDGKS